MPGLRLLPAVVCGVGVVVGAALPPGGGAAETGTVAGRVTLTRHVRGVPLPSNVYLPRAVGRRDVSAGPEIKNVIVYLRGASFSGALPSMRREIRQINEAFSPRVVAITRGSTVDFPNADPIFHNVFSLSGAATFDLGRFPQGASRSRVFGRAGVVKVYCHLHSHMSATILVLDHPYFATPALDGSFALDGLPAGRHTVVAWHERVGEQTAAVEVQPGQTTAVSLLLPLEGDS